MMPKFSSKEIHFLKSEDPLTPPSSFLSDLAFTPTPQMENLSRRLISDRNREANFVCAVFRLPELEDKAEQEKASRLLEAGFDSVLTHERGIWEGLDHRTFALVYWDFKQKQKAQRILASLKEKIATALKIDILTGLAWFPHKEFSDMETIANALKALDHAGFFKGDHQQEFDAVSLNICGDRRYQLGECEQAIAEYEKGLAMAPKNINLLNSLGVCYGIQGEVDKAAETFEQALALNPGEIMVIYNMGLIHQIHGNPDKAVLFLKKAHGIDPEIFEVELLLGHLLHKEGKAEQALGHIEAALNLNADSGAALTLKGEILLDRDLPAQAGPLFGEAVKRSPSNARAISGYAVAMALQNKNMTIALSFARESVALDPGNPTFRERLDTIEELCRSKEEAPGQNQAKSA